MHCAEPAPHLNEKGRNRFSPHVARKGCGKSQERFCRGAIGSPRGLVRSEKQPETAGALRNSPEVGRPPPLASHAGCERMAAVVRCGCAHLLFTTKSVYPVLCSMSVDRCSYSRVGTTCKKCSSPICNISREVQHFCKMYRVALQTSGRVHVPNADNPISTSGWERLRVSSCCF